MQLNAGVKHDQGKPRVGLVLSGFRRALLEVSKVGTHGARKYADGNWLHLENGEARYTDAMLRHYLGETADGPFDDIGNGGSGLLHAAHVAWNALARLELMLREFENEKPQQAVPLTPDLVHVDGLESSYCVASDIETLGKIGPAEFDAAFGRKTLNKVTPAEWGATSAVLRRRQKVMFGAGDLPAEKL